MDSSAVNIFDAVVVALIVISGVLAALRGFVRETLAIAGWVGAAYLTFFFFEDAKPYGRQLIESEWIADLASALVLFIALLVVLWLFIHALVVQVRKSALGPLDRSLGFVFGLARGILVLGLIQIALALFGFKSDDFPPWLAHAKTMIIINKSAVLIAQSVPDDVLPMTAEKLEALQGDIETGRGMLELEQLVDPPVATKPAEGEEEPSYSEQEARGMDRIHDLLAPDDESASSTEEQ